MAPEGPLLGVERGASDITTVSPIDAHRILYGRTLTGGTLVYSNLATTGAGLVESDYLNMVIALAPHEIEGIQKVYVNSDVAIDLELSDGVMTVSDHGIYGQKTSTTVTTGTVPVGGQLNLQGTYTSFGNVNLTLVVGGTPVYNTTSSNITPDFVYQNTSGSAQAFTLTGTTSAGFSRAALQLLNCNFQVSDKYKSLISFHPINGGTPEWLEFLGWDVAGLEPTTIYKDISESEWDNTHTMSGIAHIHVRVKYDTATLEGRLPNIACEIKGRKTFDPRDSSTVWNDNPALMIRDYLTNASYGCGVAASEIDDEAIIAAANRCDSTVTTNHATIGDGNTGGTVFNDGGFVAWRPTGSSVVDRFLPFHISDIVRLGVSGDHNAFDVDLTVVSFSEDKKGFTTDRAWGSSDEETGISVSYNAKRFTANGIADTANNRKNNLEYMLTSCAGKLAYSNGKFTLYAGEYRSGTLTIDEGDMIGPVSITTRPPASSLFNSVKGFYNSRNEDFVAKDYPPYTDATAISEDGRTNYIDLPLRYTTNQKIAERLASIAVKRHRLFKTVTVQCNMSAFRHQIGDTVVLNYARASISNDTYEIIDYQITLGEKPSISLTLQEIANTVYSV